MGIISNIDLESSQADIKGSCLIDRLIDGFFDDFIDRLVDRLINNVVESLQFSLGEDSLESLVPCIPVVVIQHPLPDMVDSQMHTSLQLHPMHG